MNKDINSEASRMMYSEATLVVGSRTYFVVMRGVDKLYEPTKAICKHDPPQDVGHSDGNGDWIYETQVSSEDMEPHIFARLSKILPDVEFDFVSGHNSPVLCLGNED